MPSRHCSGSKSGRLSYVSASQMNCASASSSLSSRILLIVWCYLLVYNVCQERGVLEAHLYGKLICDYERHDLHSIFG